MSVKFSANYFDEIKILLFAEKTLSDITKLEVVGQMPMLNYCNGFVFASSVIQRDDRPDDVVYLNYFYYTKSEKIESSKWNGHAVEVHDATGVKLFEEITTKIKVINFGK